MTRRRFFTLLAVPFLAAWVPIRRLLAKPRVFDRWEDYRRNYTDTYRGDLVETMRVADRGKFKDLVAKMRSASDNMEFRPPVAGPRGLWFWQNRGGDT